MHERKAAAEVAPAKEGRGVQPVGLLLASFTGLPALARCRSGARMASAGADKVVRIWEPGSGAQKGALHGMLETVTEARPRPAPCVSAWGLLGEPRMRGQQRIMSHPSPLMGKAIECRVSWRE